MSNESPETFQFPLILTNRNDGRGHSWHRTSAERKFIEGTLATLGHRRTAPYSVPVALRVIRVLGKGERLWDADSVLRGNAKELIDSLVALGWFHDDSPKWIVTVDGRQDDTRRDVGPCVELAVEKV